MFRTFIRSESKKKLTIRINGIRAYNLAAKEHDTTSPYCEIAFRKSKFSTSVQEKTLNPVWDDVFELGSFGDGDAIELDCFDGKDSEGHVSVPLKDFLKPGKYQKSYPLVAKNKAAGGNGFIELDLFVDGPPTQQVFRLDLELVLAYQRQKYPDLIIPIFMRRALDYLRKHALDEEGIFRKSGAYDQINAAIEALDKDYDYDFLPKLKDPHSVCGLVKKFIRDIPGTVLTTEFCQLFLDAMEAKSPLEPLRGLLQQLPLCNREVLREVLELAREVCNHPATKMQPNNIAIVLGPNIVGTSGAAIAESGQGHGLTEYFLTQFSALFPDRPTPKDIHDALARIDAQVKSTAGTDKDKKEKKDKKDKKEKNNGPTSPNPAPLPVTNSNSLRGKQNAADALPSPSTNAMSGSTSNVKRPGDTSARGPVDSEASKHAAKKSAEELLANKKPTPAPPTTASPAPVSPKPARAATPAAASSSSANLSSAAVAASPAAAAAAADDSGDELEGVRHDITEEAGAGADATTCIYRVRGEWTGKSAGGPLSSSTWRHNQQVFVQSPETKTVKVKLIQDAEKVLHDIGFYVLRIPNTTDKRLLILPSEIPECEFKQVRELWREVKLEANQRYCIIPCTYAPGQEAPYRLFIQTEGRLQTNLSPKESELAALEFENEWFDKSAGGCRNHPTCPNNPQYLLVAKEKTSITVILSQTEVKNFDTIGLYLLKTKDPSRKMGRITANDVVHKSEFSAGHEATLTFTLAEGSDAVLLPCTFDPAREAPFKLTLLYSKPLKVRELRDERREACVWSDWRPELIGGAPESPSWRQNPQFFLMMFNKYRLQITLRQRVGTSVGDKPAKLPQMGILLIRNELPHRIYSLQSSNILHASSFEAVSKITFEIELDRAPGPYILMPFTNDPAANGRFSLTVLNREENSTTRGFALIGANYSWQKRQFKGEWRGESAAGAQSFANPQLCLRLFGKRSRVAVVLSAAGSFQYGIALHSASENARVTSGTSLFTTPLASGADVSFERELDPGCYILMPLQSVSGKDAPFELSVYAADATLELDVAGSDIIKKSQAKGGKKDQNDPKNFTTAFNDFQIIDKIGDGSIGNVYRAKLQGKEIAVKKILMVDAADKEYFKKEINILKRAKHSCVAAFLGASLLDDDALVLYELSSNGSLYNLLHVAKRELNWDQRLKLAIDAAKGVIYLHNHKRVHRHLSPWNLLVDKDLNCKVTDFAFPRRVLNAQAGSLRWCAPEVLMTFSSFSDRSDSYSFGMLLYELLSLQVPFEGLNPYQVGRAIDEGEMPSLPKGTLKAMKRLVKDCWDREPQNRPAMQAICDKLESFIVNGKALPLVEPKK